MSPSRPAAVVDVSIIVIAANVRDEVFRCFRSIDDHSGPLEVESILVDNGSRDGTADEVAAHFPHVRILRRPTNEGLAARNHGLRIASGRFRMFLDSDAILTEGALTELVRFCERDSEVGLVGPRLVHLDGSFQPSARRFPPFFLPLMRRPPLRRFLEEGATVRHHLMLDEPARTREVEYVLGACQLFSAEAQRAAGEIDPYMFFGPDDADWCFRIRTAGFKVVYHPDAVVVHNYRRFSAQRPMSRTAWRHLTAFFRFQWKWRRSRSRLIAEGKAMDEAAAASEVRREPGRAEAGPAVDGDDLPSALE